MKKLQILLLFIIGLIFSACGNTYINEDDNSKIYDMWKYMTPPHSYDVEYSVYENGSRVDYFWETSKVFSSGIVERTSGDETTTLTPYENTIRIVEPNGEIVQVQRYIKIGDTNIFQSSSIHSCRADEYFLSIIIKGVEFYNVIKVSCQTNSSSSEIYYGFEEGIISIHRNENGTVSEIVKVDERELQ